MARQLSSPAALVALAMALSGCLWTAAPATPALPPPSPTPPPTPTPTPAPRRIAYPSGTPLVELPGAGELLYVGHVSARDHRWGAVAVDASGGEPRLLAEGPYDSVVWAPDGRRFAAATTQEPGRVPGQVALVAADGRLLRRLTFEGAPSGLAWAPDAWHLALTVHPPGGDGRTAAWILSEDGARELMPGRDTAATTWSADGRLALVVVGGDGPATGEARRAVWTVEAGGGEPRELATGDLWPLGWSPDGTTLYALGEARAPAAAGEQALWLPAELLAIDGRTGERRTVVTAQALGAQPPAAGFDGGLVVPDGDGIALWLTSRGEGRAEPQRSLVVVDGAGRPRLRDRVPAGAGRLAWSPDGDRLAYAVDGPDGEIRVLRVGSTDTAARVAAGGGGPIELAWSPDGRWLAFTRNGTLEIMAAADAGRSWPVVESASRSPAWRPLGAP